MEIGGFLYQFQSGFRSGDSTINQLIFLVHKVYEALEFPAPPQSQGKGPGNEAGRRSDVRVVFLDISKAFD